MLTKRINCMDVLFGVITFLAEKHVCTTEAFEVKPNSGEFVLTFGANELLFLSLLILYKILDFVLL